MAGRDQVMDATKHGNLPVLGQVRAQYPSMTGSLKAFADFVLAEPVSIARMSIHGAVAAVGVSTATANRFARALGFGGYAAFRAELIRGFEQALEPVRRLEQQISKASTSLEIFRASLQEDLRNIQRSLELLSTDACAQAVDLVLSAKRIQVIGFDDSASLGRLLANGLGQIRDNVFGGANTDGGMGAARQLCRFGRGDLVIAIAFPRYMKDTIELARQAKERGTSVLAITDSHQSPLASVADVNLYAVANRQFASVANGSALVLIEALVAAVAHRAPGALRRAEEFTSFVLPWLENPSGPSGEERAEAPPAARPRAGRGRRQGGHAS
jgi:DNA-binding MurR/RpiR family transcriptional regulator